MEITEVRVKLMSGSNDKLRAFCSITIDNDFVIRDLKVIEGAKGPFVAMPSRKLTQRCSRCGGKNHYRASYCNDCGAKLYPERMPHDLGIRSKLHADIAHPINSRCRELIQKRILEDYSEEIERSKDPDYRPAELDVFDVDYLSDEVEDVLGEGAGLPKAQASQGGEARYDRPIDDGGFDEVRVADRDIADRDTADGDIADGGMGDPADPGDDRSAEDERKAEVELRESQEFVGQASDPPPSASYSPSPGPSYGSSGSSHPGSSHYGPSRGPSRGLPRQSRHGPQRHGAPDPVRERRENFSRRGREGHREGGRRGDFDRRGGRPFREGRGRGEARDRGRDPRRHSPSEDHGPKDREPGREIPSRLERSGEAPLTADLFRGGVDPNRLPREPFREKRPRPEEGKAEPEDNFGAGIFS